MRKGFVVLAKLACFDLALAATTVLLFLGLRCFSCQAPWTSAAHSEGYPSDKSCRGD